MIGVKDCASTCILVAFHFPTGPATKNLEFSRDGAPFSQLNKGVQRRYGHKHQMMCYIIKMIKNMQKAQEFNKTIRKIQWVEAI